MRLSKTLVLHKKTITACENKNTTYPLHAMAYKSKDQSDLKAITNRLLWYVKKFADFEHKTSWQLEKRVLESYSSGDGWIEREYIIMDSLGSMEQAGRKALGQT